MKITSQVCGLLVSVGLYAVAAHAQVSRSVNVSHSGSQIAISIDRPTPLTNVLDALCQEVNAQCEGTQLAIDVMVPAREISADWNHVLVSLLEGAELNYAARGAAGPSPAMLSILGIVPKVSPAEGRSAPATVAEEWPTETTVLPEAPSYDPAALSASGLGPSAAGGGEAAQSSQASSGEPATLGGQADRLLFPDGRGDPIPVSHQSLEYLLFPDSQGNPIPVASQGSSPYQLFPDASGELIPTSNQPLQYLLFPDADGRLIPVAGATAH